MANQKERYDWTNHLSDEDLTFLKRFLFASGSLKELAMFYGISYPTVRLRLDRLIEKIKIWDSQEIASDHEKLVRSLYIEGHLDKDALKTLLAYEEEK